jgi:hypothetical protein
MSRTIRRKSAKYLYDWELRDWTYIGSFLQRFLIDIRSEEGKRRIARFHSDNGFGDYSKACPPRWYRRMHNRRYDQEDKKQVARYLGGFAEDAVLVNRKGNASWYW